MQLDGREAVVIFEGARGSALRALKTCSFVNCVASLGAASYLTLVPDVRIPL